MRKNQYIVALTIISLIFCTLFSQCQGKLVYLLQVSRHGAKYPEKNVTKIIDPVNIQGQLTGVGMRQHYLLGSYLHQDYIVKQQLVSGRLNPRQVQIYSSSYQRAISSAYSQAYGLFPTSSGHTIPPSINPSLLNPPFIIQSNLQSQMVPSIDPFALYKGFQPPVIAVDDSVINYCPNYGLFISARLKEVAKNLTTFQGQHSIEISKMVVAFNMSALQATVPGMADLYDNIMGTLNLGRDMPSTFNDYDLKSLRFISDYYHLLIQASTFGQTLATPLLRFMIDKFTLTQTRQPQKKLSIFVCHAQNLFQLQSILNLTSIQCLTQKWNSKPVTTLNCMDSPDFASNLIFQIHQNQQTFSHEIKVKYNGQYANLCEKKLTTCDLDEFIARISKYVKSDYQKQCGITNIEQEIQNHLSNMFLKQDQEKLVINNEHQTNQHQTMNKQHQTISKQHLTMNKQQISPNLPTSEEISNILFTQ